MSKNDASTNLSVYEQQSQPKRASGASGIQVNGGQLFDRLPDEVLGEIFWWCCPTYMDRYRSFPFQVLYLSHVCKKWRQVVLQSPSLWSFLPLAVYGLEKGSLDEPSRMLRHWLEHTHDCPVTIDVRIVEKSDKRPPANALKQILALINAITDVKPALTEKVMDVSAAIDATAVPNHPDDLFPDVAEQYSWTDPIEGEESSFPRRGSVQLLCMRRSPVMYGLEGHAPLGPCLSRVELRDQHGFIAFCLDECFVVLENFSNLEHCGVRIGGFGPDDETHQLQVPHLKSLALEWRQSAGEGIGILLDSLHAPGLADLELRGCLPFRERRIGERWPHLRMFLERNNSPLKVLELAKMDCTLLDLIGCLAALSASGPSMLTHLTLSQCELDDECIRKLWGDEESPKVFNAIRTLMRLENLGLEYCDIYSLEDLVCSLCVDHLLWPGARAVIAMDHTERLKCSLEELFILHCGSLSEEAQSYLDESPVAVEYEEGESHAEEHGVEEED